MAKTRQKKEKDVQDQLLDNSNSKFQFLGAKTADSVGFATKMSLFLSFFLEGKSKRRVK